MNQIIRCILHDQFTHYTFTLFKIALCCYFANISSNELYIRV